MWTSEQLQEMRWSSSYVQKKWSTSCSVNKLPGKTETGKMLDLQGNLLKVPLLLRPLHVPCHLCICCSTHVDALCNAAWQPELPLL